QAVPIDLPQVTATKLDDKPEVIQLAIDIDGLIFLNGEAIHRDALDARFAVVSARQPELHLRADRKVAYEKVADVMAAAQRANIVKIAFLTEPAR
ncbi:MAG TPA: biopolymer transporter ExbD, partial [Azonexus sp.]|nr:biopolymer transporter ExbD [Azonexus sp.]